MTSFAELKTTMKARVPIELLTIRNPQLVKHAQIVFAAVDTGKDRWKLRPTPAIGAMPASLNMHDSAPYT